MQTLLSKYAKLPRGSCPHPADLDADLARFKRAWMGLASSESFV